ncbi:type II toxin-antitoxin system RelE/ParE family toxin [Stratiformator vulcanicus]|uniref:Plasmid stabilization system protein n=1 Tax=Stratiformator vulcanicus TaxID=2527980 RepID=A0A517QYU6_9PLAN|nr:type II toxin-antitoxin system RelE/ParE family toxin [Stratiformator vulcanicus]QDT36827.1 Plasmid stabilization system protein [Stratiformator vulcanicus]
MGSAVTGIVRSTEAAHEDLMRIGRYIAENSGSLERALEVLDQIDLKCKKYARQPLMGDPRPDLGPDVRLFAIYSYLVIYRPSSSGIEVLMVTHGARDLPKLIRDRIS